MTQGYPLAEITLKRMLAERASPGTSSHAGPQKIGPAILRAPPAVKRAAPVVVDVEEGGEGEGGRPDDMLGELLDMVLVGADEADSGLPEVHLVFKAEVFGGLHLRLVKKPEGLEAFFSVEDAAARREVAGHVEDLVTHLKRRGFSIIGHHLEVQ